MPIYSNGNNLISFVPRWKGFCHGKKTRHNDQIPSGPGKNCSTHLQTGSAEILSNTLETRLHPATAFHNPGTETILSDRLSRHGRITKGFRRPAKDTENNQNTAFYNTTKSPAKAAKKRAYEKLLTAVFSKAADRGLIEQRCQASIDSTGLESSYLSRHFLMRRGKRTSRYRRWTKLTIVGDNSSHLIAAATVSTGPNNDCPHLAQTVTEAVEHLPIYQLLGDSGYDSEANHQLCREQLGIISTVIAYNNRRNSSGVVRGCYRRQMKKRFPRRKFRQRWQVESIFSRFKRRLGHFLRSRSDQSRGIECLFRVLTYNLMILYLLFKKSLIRQYI